VRIEFGSMPGADAKELWAATSAACTVQMTAERPGAARLPKRRHRSIYAASRWCGDYLR